MDSLLQGYALRPSPLKSSLKPQVGMAHMYWGQRQRGGVSWVPVRMLLKKAALLLQQRSPMPNRPGPKESTQPSEMHVERGFIPEDDHRKASSVEDELPGRAFSIGSRYLPSTALMTSDPSPRAAKRRRQRPGAIVAIDPEDASGDGGAGPVQGPIEGGSTNLIRKPLRLKRSSATPEAAHLSKIPEGTNWEQDDDRQKSDVATAAAASPPLPKEAWEMLPLPPELQRLRQALAILGEVLKFLSSQQATPTWRAVTGVLNHLNHLKADGGGLLSPAAGSYHSGQGDSQDSADAAGILSGSMNVAVTLEDAYALSRLVPSVLQLRDRSRPHQDQGIQAFFHHHVGDLGPDGGLSGGRLGGSGSVEADSSHEGWSSQLVNQFNKGLAVNSGHPVPSSSCFEHDKGDLVLTLLDPGR